MKRTLLLALSLFLVVVGINDAAAIRQADVSSFVNTGSRQALAFFHSPHFLYSGGVSPRARSIVFKTNDGASINIDDLNLLFQTKNQNPTSVEVSIEHNKDRYRLPIPDKMLCPLLRFVARGSITIFTIPVVRASDAYFSENGLEKTIDGGAYIAKEFARTEYERFFELVDLNTKTEALPPQLANSIIENINNSVGSARATDDGTYVNADFNIDYKAHLSSTNGRRYVDIEGLPLQYDWDIGTGNNAVIKNVTVYSFPTHEGDLQYNAVLFFQNTAVFREFARRKEARFNDFMKQACDHYDKHFRVP